MRSAIKENLKKGFYRICTISLERAAMEQGLSALSDKLEKIVLDIKDQYSTVKLNSRYLIRKARNMHAFQILLVNKVIGEFQAPTIVDIGDSSGTHLKYILGLHSHNKDIKTLSINLDTEAVDRIKAKGFRAVNAKAENMGDYNINADIFLCFQTLEHLMNPCQFLRQLSTKTDARYLIITVPYLRRSRVALHHIREDRPGQFSAEEVHIFELNPEDWKLLARHSGWEVVGEETYLQYPKRGVLRILRPFWKRYDFEGFYGIILKKDDRWSSKYSDW